MLVVVAYLDAKAELLECLFDPARIDVRALASLETSVKGLVVEDYAPSSISMLHIVPVGVLQRRHPASCFGLRTREISKCISVTMLYFMQNTCVVH